jgi:1-deoxy-D-xylulose-5-phosphate reductoisomerase
MGRSLTMQRRHGALCILGATGTVGVATLSVAEALGIAVHTVTAATRADELARLAIAHRARRAVVADPAALPALRAALAGSGIIADAGPEALCAAAADPDAPLVMSAIVGGAGLAPTLAALRAGKRVGIANKEPLVMAGALVMAEAARCGAEIVPVDSEHSAIFQCLAHHSQDEIVKLIITGSGGPFRQVADLGSVSVEAALKHPNWSMGPKITIDSATLMNKALEVIEAKHLFGLDLDRIEVLIHPQSVIHSMVAFIDGSVMAHLGEPDMRVPIQLALTWPERAPGQVPLPDFAQRAALTFEHPDRARFPALDLGYAAARAGGLAPVALNAANEVLVAAFLARRIPFVDIARRVAAAVASVPGGGQPDLDSILACDAAVRARTAAELP